MTDVVIIDYNVIKVGEHWDKSLSDLIFEASYPLIKKYGNDEIKALYIGNMLSEFANIQSNLGAYAADILGLFDIDAFHVNCAEASSSAAIYQAILAIKSGRYDVVLAGGVEKMTDLLYRKAIEGLSLALNADLVRMTGLNLASIAGIMTKEYIKRYNVTKEMITSISVQDHKNAVNSPHAQYKYEITIDQAINAPPIADPLTIYDVTSISDGGAFLILASREYAEERNLPYIEVLGVGMAINTLSVVDRNDILEFKATTKACEKALSEASINISDIDVYEINDDFSITGILSLEALGVFGKGEAAKNVYEGKTALTSNKPVNTFGGLKARGHPVGATGAYQTAEVCMQLMNKAGSNQVSNVKYGLIQNYGGLDSVAVVMILGKGDLNA